MHLISNNTEAGVISEPKVSIFCTNFLQYTYNYLPAERSSMLR